MDWGWYDEVIYCSVPFILWREFLSSFTNSFPCLLICIFNCHTSVSTYSFIKKLCNGWSWSVPHRLHLCLFHELVNANDYILKPINFKEVIYIDTSVALPHFLRGSYEIQSMLFKYSPVSDIDYAPKCFVLLHLFHDVKPLLSSSNHCLILHEYYNLILHEYYKNCCVFRRNSQSCIFVY